MSLRARIEAELENQETTAPELAERYDLPVQAALSALEYLERHGRAKRVEPDRFLVAPPWRPKTRADCKDGPRPCPYLGCAHHLHTDISQHGRVIVRSETLPDGSPRPSCALDVADKGEHTIPQVAAIYGTVWQAVQGIEQRALIKLRKRKDHFE